MAIARRATTSQAASTKVAPVASTVTTRPAAPQPESAPTPPPANPTPPAGTIPETGGADPGPWTQDWTPENLPVPTPPRVPGPIATPGVIEPPPRRPGPTIPSNSGPIASPVANASKWARIAGLASATPSGTYGPSAGNPWIGAAGVPGQPLDDKDKLPSPMPYPPVPYPSNPFSTPITSSLAMGFSAPGGGGFSGSTDADLVNHITKTLMARGGRG